MVDQLSPLGDAYHPGRHGGTGPGLVLAERDLGSIVQLKAWRDTEEALRTALRDVSGLALAGVAGVVAETTSGFGIGPGTFLVLADDEDLYARLAAAITSDVGAVTDLSHGRTVFRVEGPSASWVLPKLFAIDFSPAAFPLFAGRATQHHDFFVAIQRVGAESFDCVVYRSFARSFWRLLCHAAEETGYEVR